MSGDGAAPRLRVEGISVTHGGVPAVVDLSLTAGAGEIVALLGRNGAGKTTTMRAITGLTPPRTGDVLYKGRNIVGRPAHLRLGAYRVPRAEAERRMEEQFARFPVLGAKRNVAAGQLSGGEQQQLAIAQGLMARPRVLLLDEPSVGLALGLVRVTFAILDELRSQGLAILLAEQSVDQPLRIADRAYVLDLGRLALSGPAAELRESGALHDAYLGRRTSPAT